MKSVDTDVVVEPLSVGFLRFVAWVFVIGAACSIVTFSDRLALAAGAAATSLFLSAISFGLSRVIVLLARIEKDTSQIAKHRIEEK